MKRERATVEINDLSTLEAINDPLRMRIIVLLDEPKSVRALAEALHVPVTRLYYHVNMLEDSGLIEVVETRKVGAMLQKLYKASGTDFKPGQELLDNIDDPQKLAEAMTSTVLDPARLDVEESLTSAFHEHGRDGVLEQLERSVGLGRAVFSVPKDQVDEYLSRLTDLVEDFRSDNDDVETELYSFTYVMAPVAGQQSGGGDGS